MLTSCSERIYMFCIWIEILYRQLYCNNIQLKSSWIVQATEKMIYFMIRLYYMTDNLFFGLDIAFNITIFVHKLLSKYFLSYIRKLAAILLFLYLKDNVMKDDNQCLYYILLKLYTNIFNSYK